MNSESFFKNIFWLLFFMSKMRSHFLRLDESIIVPQYKMNILNQITGNTAFILNENNSENNIDCLSPSSCDASLIHNSSSSSLFNEKILEMSKNPNEIFIQPRNIGMIPTLEWTPRPISLKQIHSSYFSKRNGVSRQFDIKLYNALCITKSEESTENYIGVTWVDSEHFKVNEKIFSHFIGTISDRSNLFDNQGLLETYGFEQVYKETNPRFFRNCHCDDVDDLNIRLFRDPQHRFSRDKTYARVV